MHTAFECRLSRPILPRFRGSRPTLVRSKMHDIALSPDFCHEKVRDCQEYVPTSRMPSSVSILVKIPLTPLCGWLQGNLRLYATIPGNPFIPLVNCNVFSSLPGPTPPALFFFVLTAPAMNPCDLKTRDIPQSFGPHCTPIEGCS